jgi:hypothetical protein
LTIGSHARTACTGSYAPIAIRPVFGSLRPVVCVQPVESHRLPAVDAGLDVANDLTAGAGAVVQFRVAHQGGLQPDGLHHFAR